MQQLNNNQSQAAVACTEVTANDGCNKHKMCPKGIQSSLRDLLEAFSTKPQGSRTSATDSAACHSEKMTARWASALWASMVVTVQEANKSVSDLTDN